MHALNHIGHRFHQDDDICRPKIHIQNGIGGLGFVFFSDDGSLAFFSNKFMHV